MQTSGYNFAKQAERRELSRIHSGRGIASVDGYYSPQMTTFYHLSSNIWFF
jgi:hypothetical protein